MTTSRTHRRIIQARLTLRQVCDGLPAAQRLWADMAPGMKAQSFTPPTSTRHTAPDDQERSDGTYHLADPTGDAAIDPDHFRREGERLDAIALRIVNLANEAKAIIHASTVEKPLMAKELQELALKADPGCEIVGRIERPGGGTYWEETYIKATTVGGVLERPYRLGVWAQRFVRDHQRKPTDAETRAHCESRRVMVKS